MKSIRKAENTEFYLLGLYVFALVPFLNIRDIQNAVGGWMYQRWRILGMGIALFLVLHRIFEMRLNCFAVLFLLYRVFLDIVTTSFSGFNSVSYVEDIFLFCLLLLLPQDGMQILQAIWIVTAGMIVVNFISMLFPSNVAAKMYFVGGKNALSIKLIPYTFLMLVYAQLRYGELRRIDIGLLCLSLCSVYMGQSGFGTIVFFMAIAGFAIFIFWKKPLKSVFIAVFLIVQTVLLFGNDFLVDNGAWIKIMGVLNKSSTLTARTDIWKAALEFFKANPAVGIGRSLTFHYINDWGEACTVYEAHNILAQSLAEGGIFGTLLYTAIFFLAIKGLNMKREHDKLIFLAIFLMLINGLGESLNHQMGIMLLLFFAYHSSQLKRQEGGALWTVD